MRKTNNITSGIEILEKFFVFDKIFDLSEYDDDMVSLYNELKQYTKESYEANYRFIFLHFDTDYYITNDQPGVMLRNLQRILWKLHISNYFCMILSQQDLQDELDRLRDEETSDDVSIQCIQHHLQDIIHLPRETNNLNVDSIQKSYMCLARAKRLHRTCMFALIESKKLLDKGIVSFGSR